MKYFANCNRVLHKEEIYLKDEFDKVHYNMKYVSLKKLSGLKICNNSKKEKYRLNYNPLKIVNRYVITDTHRHPIINISIGKKLIHIIEYNDEKYTCKGSFLNINYRLYRRDDEIASIRVIKKDKIRYFEIILEDSLDTVFALCLLVLAQTIKDRVWFIYGL